MGRSHRVLHRVRGGVRVGLRPDQQPVGQVRGAGLELRLHDDTAARGRADVAVGDPHSRVFEQVSCNHVSKE